MRTAVISDIHGNLEALEAVLNDAKRAGVDAICSLGDIVGYGADPAACIELVRSRATVSLMGNHDAAVAGQTPLEEFNHFARQALEWTRRHLDAACIGYLGSLPYTHPGPDRLLVHASPREPDRWHYVHGLADVEEHFAAFTEPICFVGHSHRPGIYAVGEGHRAFRHGSGMTLRPGRRYLVNVGSVGQPRDRDPRAAYAIYDEEKGQVDLRRVAYPLAITQERILATLATDDELPAFLADRLAHGV